MIYVWDDMVKGKVLFEFKMVGGDFVIKKCDGMLMYNFVVVVDDYMMEISYVFCGDDYVVNMFK